MRLSFSVRTIMYLTMQCYDIIVVANKSKNDDNRSKINYFFDRIFVLFLCGKESEMNGRTQHNNIRTHLIIEYAAPERTCNVNILRGRNYATTEMYVIDGLHE